MPGIETPESSACVGRSASDEQQDVGLDIKFVSAKVPLNLIYDYQIPNTRINLDPYVGLRLRGNVWGEWKSDYYDKTYDLFDSDEGDCKRFQVGWSIGLKARINNAFFVCIGIYTVHGKNKL